MFNRACAALLITVLCAAVLSPSFVAYAQNPGITINVDAGANRHPINPYVYGVAHASAAQLADLNCPLNRNGGNNTSRYNWQLNADNRANDWYYESIAEPSSVAGERSASASSTRVTLRWSDNSNNEQGFYVERALKGSNSFARVGQTAANATSFAETVSRGTYV